MSYIIECDYCHKQKLLGSSSIDFSEPKTERFCLAVMKDSQSKHACPDCFHKLIEEEGQPIIDSQ